MKSHICPAIHIFSYLGFRHRHSRSKASKESLSDGYLTSTGIIEPVDGSRRHGHIKGRAYFFLGNGHSR
jgi:hypothetical protein